MHLIATALRTRRNGRRWAALLAAAAFLGVHSLAAGRSVPADVVREVGVRSSADGAVQPAWFYAPNAARIHHTGEPPVPLVVALHSWSSGYGVSSWRKYMRECRRFGFALIHPHFRGPNTRPKACASDLAIRDVVDAAAYAQTLARIDPRRIYLVGASGGGHMALMVACRAPRPWAAVSAWNPPTDLVAWYHQCRRADIRYAFNLEDVCGGPPGEKTEAAYRQRSPLFHLAAARGLPIDLNAGIRNGLEGPVPTSHALRAFNVLAQANGHPDKAFSREQIATLSESRSVPEALAGRWDPEERRASKILLRRVAGPVRITLFDGAREMNYHAALAWLAQHRKDPPKPGTAASSSP